MKRRPFLVRERTKGKVRQTFIDVKWKVVSIVGFDELPPSSQLNGPIIDDVVEGFKLHWRMNGFVLTIVSILMKNKDDRTRL